MATVVFFHAHPDDETLFTGGSMAKAAALGHRVVLVTATRGEQGMDRSGGGRSGAAMAERREQELRDAAASLKVARLELLGFGDSGINGDAPGGFSALPAPAVEEAAQRLAGIVADEGADVLVGYDERGIYGHPDHLQVHKVGLRAAQLADVERLFLATVDRDHIQAVLQLAAAFGLSIEDQTLDLAVTAGIPKERITRSVDVRDHLDAKREALAAHATQFPPDSSLFQLPPEAFALVFGTEWFIELAVLGPRER